MSVLDQLIADAQKTPELPVPMEVPEDAVAFVEAALLVSERLIAAGVDSIAWAGWTIVPGDGRLDLTAEDGSGVSLVVGPPVWIPIRPVGKETKRDTLTAATSALRALLKE